MGKSWSMKHMSDSLPWWTSSFERGCVFSISTARVNSKEILTEGSVTQRHCSTCFDHSKNLEVVEWPLVGDISIIHQPSLVSQLVKNLPAMQETPLLFLGWEDPMVKDRLPTPVFLDFQVAQIVKNLPAMRETWVWSLGWEDPLEKGMATHSTIPAWRISWPEEFGGLQSLGSQRVRHAWANFTHINKLWNIVVVQLLSRVGLSDPMDCSTPCLPVLHYLLEFAWVHIHWVGDAIEPLYPLLPSSFAFNLSQHQGLFQWVGSSHHVAKVLELQHPSFHNFQGWFPLGLTGLISLKSKGLSRIFSSTTIWNHQFFGAQPSLWSNSHICT